ncbi:DUF1810 domain-containing protein [Roseovarius salis]|uniref:DUF1810 domain-containing protein n=1 Tax=Roseovarius salis TaxID=3376063 RepID=UPI0037C71475
MNLERFTEAQARIWPAPLKEIRAGRKESHWMWFVFPQLRGLGRSATAQRYGLADLDEAKAYLGHEILGPRLIAIGRAMMAHEGSAPESILGAVDAMKLRSSATLFRAAGGDRVFDDLLTAFYSGVACPLTENLLREEGDGRRRPQNDQG